MKTYDWCYYLAGIAAVLIGFSFGGFLFGMLVHESGHAIVCLIFGLPRPRARANGMKLEKARPQDFEKAVEAIRRIVKKLNSKGTL